MNENYETMTTSEEQIVLEDGSDEVAISVAGTTTIQRSVTLSADVKDKTGYLQVGHMTTNGCDESMLYVTVKLPAVMKNAMISKAMLKLRQSFAEYAETGHPMDLYQVDSFAPDDLIFDGKEPIATIVTNAVKGHYRNLDITKVIEQAIGGTVYLVLKLRGEWNRPGSCECDCSCECNCECHCNCCCNCGCTCRCAACNAVNATFFAEGSLQLTCAGEPIAEGVYQMQSYYNGRHLTMGQNWINPGDMAVQKYGQTENPIVLLGQMWRIRLLPDGLYAISSIMAPTMGLAVGTVEDVNRVIAKEIGDCTAEVPEDARWMIIPYNNLWIMYNVWSKLVISTPCQNLKDFAPLEAVTYVNECCVTGAHWMILPIENNAIEIALYNDLIGWIYSDTAIVEISERKTTSFRVAYYSEACTSVPKWTSSDTSVASVTSDGIVTALKTGQTIISVTIGNNHLECTVKVTEYVFASSVMITPSNITMNVGENTYLNATVLPNNTTDPLVKWNSNNTDVVTVDSSSGLVSANRSGIATICASVQDGSNIKAFCTVIVNCPMWTCYQTKNDCYKKGTDIGTVKGIVVHSTGAANPNLKRYVEYPEKLGPTGSNHWNKSKLSKMVHGFIGLDKDKNVAIVNTLPYNYACWGVGNGTTGLSYNYSPQGHIQFEICEDEKDNSEYFYNAVWGAAVQYCSYICKTFDLPVSTIVSHQEAHLAGYGSNHIDPHNWLNNFKKTMDDFRAAVSERLDAES